MVIRAMRSRFPTRQLMPAFPAADGAAGRGFSGAGPVPDAPALLRFVKGVDPAPRAMPTDEIAALGDAFTRNVLLAGRNPLTLRELLDSVAGIAAPDFSFRKQFLVAEGAHPRSAGLQDFELNARLVVTWHRRDESATDMLLSASPVPDDPDSLLQLIAWSDTDGSFHFFERKAGQWAWAGNGFHALQQRSRGQGPFDSHINGSLVMKELKAPWSHWHSMSSGIARETFPAGSPLATDPLFAQFTGADELEAIVRTGILRWTRSRLRRDLSDRVLQGFEAYLRQVLWTTSVNLISARQPFDGPASRAIVLPTTFFIDADALEFLAVEMGEGESLIPDAPLIVGAAAYREATRQRRLTVADEAGGGPPLRLTGDTQFAFLVPERAQEDLIVLKELVEREVIAPRTALCLLSVDFPNPIFSERRAALLAHAPAELAAGGGGADFDRRFVGALRDALARGVAAIGSPEAEFLALFDSADSVAALRARIAAYFEAWTRRLATSDGVADLLELADSRRLASRRRKLLEFGATLAAGEGTRAYLAIREDAQIFVKATDLGEEAR